MRRFGSPSSSYGTSNASSGFSGFHDSAASMSPGGNKRAGRARRPASQQQKDGTGSGDSSGRSGRSAGSTGSNGAALGLEQQEPSAAMDAGGEPGLLPNGMSALPEDAAIADAAAHHQVRPI